MQEASGEEYYWAKKNCRAYGTSQYSGWAVGGGANGAGLACGSNYPSDAESWMVYGPFSLADATAAVVDFQVWVYSEPDWDVLSWMASTDGDWFYGPGGSGNSGGWLAQQFDLSDVYLLGDLAGEPQVWIAFLFESDYESTYAEGAYLDNIVLKKCTSASCPSAAGAAPDALPETLHIRTAAKRLTQ
jgi:hypothetical protein